MTYNSKIKSACWVRVLGSSTVKYVMYMGAKETEMGRTYRWGGQQEKVRAKGRRQVCLRPWMWEQRARMECKQTPEPKEKGEQC